MDWGSTLVGLGGLGVAGLSLVLTYRERTQHFREALYGKRLEAYPELLAAVWKLVDASIDEGRQGSSSQPSSTALLELERRWAVLLSKEVTLALGRLREEYWELEDVSPASEDTRRQREPNITCELWFYLIGGSVNVLEAMRDDLGVDRLSGEMLRTFSTPLSERTPSPAI